MESTSLVETIHLSFTFPDQGNIQDNFRLFYVSVNNSPIFLLIRKLVDESSGQDLYIRVRASEQVSDLNENRRQKIIVAVLVISGILIFFSLLFCIWKKTTKKARLTTVQDNKEDVDVHLFDLSTIATATNNFSCENLIGAGGFGPVYKLRCVSLGDNKWKKEQRVLSPCSPPQPSGTCMAAVE
ncbi:hypothetical protein Q3G72_034277 [Acer saccharum]|nr:hypothetical protein Q3G72_034277 [Acer saccharum]